MLNYVPDDNYCKKTYSRDINGHYATSGKYTINTLGIKGIPYIRNNIPISYSTYYKFYDHIKAKDEAFFMKENDAIKKYEGTSAITQIFKFKSLFQTLNKKDKDMLFYYLNILCYIGARYFTVSNK